MTKQSSKSKTVRRDRPVITPDMIEAGVMVLFDYLGDEGDERTMSEIIEEILLCSLSIASPTSGT